MKLYKYINSEFEKDALEKGCFRLGTLFDYRNEEGYGNEIGEGGEGILQLVADSWKGKEIDLSSNSPEAVLIRDSLKISLDDEYAKNKIVFGEGSEMVFNRQSINSLVFCASKEFDREVMEQFGCDSCILINNAQRFLSEISKSISHIADYQLDSHIVYNDRIQRLISATHLHPALLKPKNYQHQKEYRALWKFKMGLPIEPIIVNSIGSTKYIEKYG